ncbi:transcriptional regulator Kaiso [Denticeps clupeoides]|uniref:Kaiso n=1 Tax=Denticeps clupeoides TaxID=299321 RepID=A0AAY4DHN8_9TELE|nr:transcriptional regulator Kaiso [Denticeps clupeoides]
MSSLKLITATDTQFPASVLKSINEQRNNGLFCDVTVIVQDRKFKAHKVILSASSTYFRHLFAVAGQIIELNFIKADMFEEILNYIYTSKICRVRSDKLEELIAAGQILGVNFIANLGVPLSQVKGLPGLSKETVGGDPTSGENLPIITECFSLSAEEFNIPTADSDKDAGDDVLFVSQTEPLKGASNSIPNSPDVIDLDQEDESTSKNDVKATNTESKPFVTKETKVEDKAMSGTLPLYSSSLSPPQYQPESTHLTGPTTYPDQSVSIPTSSAGSSACGTPAQASSVQLDLTSSSLPVDGKEVLGVQKKKVTTIIEKSPDRQGKIKLTDLCLSSTSNDVGMSISQPAMTCKKTVSLDKASEIDSLSTGCKIYANIGENTFDIVPVKEDPEEGDSRGNPGRKAQMLLAHNAAKAASISPRSGPGRKKPKVDAEDHYEIIMDGKTFYVCVVCKRPYVCLTSLRRHFNTHSWEKKYPCHYCSKVFPLAEYRTKHEISHTGERRYQCLLCNETFINYQLLSSHCKQAHNQDPSGRKEKEDTNNNLYRLLPYKTMHLKNIAYAAENSGTVPIINADGTVQHIDPGRSRVSGQGLPPSGQGKILNWSELFNEPEAHTRPVAHVQPVASAPVPGAPVNADGSPEFEFVIPETY